LQRAAEQEGTDLTLVIFRTVTTVLGAIALLAGLAELVASSWHVVEVLVVVAA
jgi:hypothetical protein